MRTTFLDVKETGWVSDGNHLVLVIVAVLSLAALVGIFIYRKRKGA